MIDAPSRAERILNLLACLLDTARPLTRDELVREVAGYPDARSAYRRAFERDKETLRALGVPLTVVALPGGEQGYRVDPHDYYLPDLGLTPEETAALRVAVGAVSLGSPAGEGALLKLGGFEGAPASPVASLPIAPALPALFDAWRSRSPVEFTYRGRRRRVEPWALSSVRGHWYVVGFDRDREALRSFRADRIDGDVAVGEAGAFEVPGDFSPGAHLHEEPWEYGAGEPVTVRVAIDAGHAEGARERLGDGAVVEEHADRSVVVELAVTDRAALRAFVLGFLEHAEVLDPPDVRAEIVAWLDALAGPA